MARPSRIGGLTRGLQTGLGIGERRRAEALQTNLLQRQQVANQEEAQRKQEEEQRKADLQKFNQRMKLLEAGKGVWDEQTQIDFIARELAPLTDGVLEGLDLENNLPGITNALSGSFKMLQKTGDVEQFGQVLAPALKPFKAVGRQATAGQRLAQAADIQAGLAGPGREQFLAGGGPQAVTELLGGAGEEGRKLLAGQISGERAILKGVTLGEDIGTLQETAPGSGEFQVLTIGGEEVRGRKKPGVEINLGKPASASERTAIAGTRATIDSLNNLKSLFDASFVGPVAGRAARAKNIFGLNPEVQAEFIAATAAFKNQVIKDITGAQMSEKEATRILSQVPQETDASSVWTAKWKQTIQNMERVNKRKIEVLRQSGVRAPETAVGPMDELNRLDAEILAIEQDLAGGAR